MCLSCMSHQRYDETKRSLLWVQYLGQIAVHDEVGGGDRANSYAHSVLQLPVRRNRMKMYGY